MKAGRVIVNLLKGVVERDDEPKLWNDLLNYQPYIRDYLKNIGLELYLDEEDGYAFLRQSEVFSEDADEKLPALISRRPMSYHMTIFCVLMRKKLIEADVVGGVSRVILERDQIFEMLKVFMQDRFNEAKTSDKIDAIIEKAVDYGFLNRLKADAKSFEVRRVVKALFNAEYLSNLNQRLMEYKEYAERNS